ncbi:MAG: glycosyltransferase family 2 protein [Bacteroidota bacterium]
MITPKISVVSPVYRAENIIEELVKRIIIQLSKITVDFEIVLVEDGSPDESWKKIKKETSKDDRVKGIKLSRNFGQHYAISAGLELSSGEWVVVMDCDLQDLPEEINNLYSKALSDGVDSVVASRITRNDSFLKKFVSFAFYKTLSWLTGVDYDHTVANFGIYKRSVVNSVVSMGDSIRYFPSMIKWVGFKSTTLEVSHSARPEGKSSYNLKKLLNLALDIILSYSDRPIRLVIKLGLIISILSIASAIFTFFQAIYGQIEVPGYASLIISIWFFSGVIVIIIGIIGLYVSKTFQAAKRRPNYITADRINFIPADDKIS